VAAGTLLLLFLPFLLSLLGRGGRGCLAWSLPRSRSGKEFGSAGRF